MSRAAWRPQAPNAQQIPDLHNLMFLPCLREALRTGLQRLTMTLSEIQDGVGKRNAHPSMEGGSNLAATLQTPSDAVITADLARNMHALPETKA